MNAPERIWAWPFMPEKQNEDMQGGWTDKPDRREAEYVRADLFAALEAEKAKAEAERDALRVVQNLHSRRKLEARADKAEALLAEAVEALEIIAEPCSVSVTPDWRAMYQGWRSICVKRVDIARATLAKITEAKNGNGV